MASPKSNTTPEDKLRQENESLRARVEELEVRLSQLKCDEQSMIKDQALESSIGGVAFADMEGRFSYVNRAFLDMWGYVSAEEVLGRPALEFWKYLEDPAAVMKSLEGGGSWAGEVTAIRKDFSEFKAELSSNMVKDPEGKPLCLMGTFVDITRRKLAEDRLREKTLAMDISSTAFCFADLEGLFTYVNRAFLDMWGYESEAEVIGRSARDVAVTPEEAERVIGLLIEKGSHTEELVARKKSGSLFNIHFTGTLLLDADDGPYGIMVSFIDITERKLMEEALRRKTYDLGERVKELDCLYNISAILARMPGSVEVMAGEVVEIIPPGWQYPEIACARITIDEKTYTSDRFKETPWVQAAQVKALGRSRGRVEVFYLEEKGPEAEGPFLEEERTLITGIAEMLGTALERRESEERGASIISQSPIGITVYDDSGQCVSANESMASMIGATKEQVLKQNFHEIGSWKAVGFYDKAMEAIRERKPMGYGATLTSSFGMNIHLDCHFIPYGTKGLIFMAHDRTKAREAEEQLANSQRMLQLVLDSIPVRVFWKDMELNYLGANRLFAQDAGLESPEEIIGKNDFNLAWKEQAEVYRADDRSVIESGDSKLDYEEPQTASDGSRLWLRTSKVPLRDTQGKIFGVMGAYEDITARKEAEAGLLVRDHAIENSINAIAFTDLQGKHTYVNQAYMDMWGVKEMSQMYELTPLDMSADPLEVEATLGELMEKGYYQGETKAKRLDDGSLFDVLFSATLLKDAEGNPSGTMASFIDITDRKRAELELKESHDLLEKKVGERTRELAQTNRILREEVAERIVAEGRALESEAIFKAAFRTSPDAMAISTLSGGIYIDVNEAFSRITGYSREEVVGSISKGLGIWENASDRESMKAALKAYGQVRDMEVTITSREGGAVIGLLSAGIFDIRGKQHLLSVFKDITDRKRAEDEVREARRARDDFLANVSHELRTPLSAVLGFSEIVIQDYLGHLDSEAVDLIRQINTSGRHLLGMINDLLFFTSIIAGKVEVSPGPFCLSDSIARMMPPFETVARGKGLALEQSLLGDLPDSLVGDHENLKVILGKLLDNALKFTSEGGVRLDVDSDLETVDEIWLRFAVSDTGIGIEPKQSELIMEHFTQVDASSTRRYGGMGVGLAIAASLAAILGGSLALESQEGQGSTFILTVPFMRHQ